MASRTILKKQRSVQLSGSEGSQESVLSDDADHRRREKSHTLSGMDVQELRNFQFAMQSREPTSPLKRFSKAKEDISNAFGYLRERLLESEAFVKRVHQDTECRSLTALIERTKGITEILQRDHMKVAFFGRTSNGKSTVINSLLRETVLPAGIGHTTNCFCSVVGVEESEGYLIPPNSQQRQNVKNVKQLAHSLHKERLNPNSLVQIFWPKTKCNLLSGEVELIDSPGIDMDPDLDQWINKYCLDADVFVLVSNAESALTGTEKRFFHQVSERLSKPNIFILNNRWDCSAHEEPDFLEEVKKQHLVKGVNFLARELAVVDEETAKDRVFFVSAKEVLHERTKQSKGALDEEEGSGLPNGWKIRMMDFEKFEKLFKECISNSAIHTKFEQHYKKGSEVVKDLQSLLQKELQDVAKNIETLEVEKKKAEDRRNFLGLEGVRVHASCEKEIKSAADELAQKLSVSIRDVESKLPTLVSEFVEPYSDDRLAAYQQKLCDFIDGKMRQRLDGISSSLGEIYIKTKNGTIERYQSDLKLPVLEGTQLYHQQFTPPPPTFLVKCSELCADFIPHPEFNLWRSLGFSNSRLQKSLSLEPMLGSVSSRLSQLWSFVPTEYAIPIALLGGAFLLPKVFSWRVWLVSLGAYSTLHLYKWSTHDPEKAVKAQLVEHITSKSKETNKATCENYRMQVGESLKTLLGGLQAQFNTEVEAIKKSHDKCSNHLQQLERFHSDGKILKNRTQLTCNYFEEFKQAHLQVD